MDSGGSPDPATSIPVEYRRKGGIMATKRLTLQQRRDIFRDLVATQDLGMPVRRSYQIITEKYEISDVQLRQIEDEGLEKEWPPLNEAMQEVG
jgi:hypothetical protein